MSLYVASSVCWLSAYLLEMYCLICVVIKFCMAKSWRADANFL